MKQVMIAGNVGRAGELKVVGADQVLSFSVAVNSKSKNEEKTTWFDVSLWGKRAEKLAQYVTKGSKVVVTGDLDTHEHNGKTYLKVRCNELTLMGGKPANGNGGNPSSDGGAEEPPPF